MCGIIGIVGKEQVSDRLVEGLKRLEYRGYDSCGVAIHRGAAPARGLACRTPARNAGKPRRSRERADGKPGRAGRAPKTVSPTAPAAPPRP